mmetsp:Transcript_9681/g.18098  ORF Transcript_9681/g.18098 Transcript_9681/m.18098 type:complete len:107 (+) Transcript_9681:199-519(+)
MNRRTKTSDRNSDSLEAKVGQFSQSTLLLSQNVLSEPLKGLEIVSDHVQRSAPLLVLSRDQLDNLSEDYELLIEDTRDALSFISTAVSCTERLRKVSSLLDEVLHS